MNSRELVSEGTRMVVTVADKGDEAVATIEEAARRHGIRAAQVTAVGAFQSGELAYFDRQRNAAERIPFTEQVEVLSLLGDIAEQDGRPVAHLHAVLGRRDGSTLGGHLRSGQVWPALEVIITEVATGLAKRVDPQTGMALINLDQRQA